MKKLETLVALWRGQGLKKKQKSKIITRYMKKFRISKNTADSTVNGRRDSVEPEEVAFLEKEIEAALKFNNEILTT